MKMILDNIRKVEKIDTGRVAESIRLLPDQIRQVLDEARLIKIPREYSQATKVVINGMGGSNLGAHIIKHAFAGLIKVPIDVVPGYEVPNYINADTIYIISSYSGTTEEPLSTYKEARKRGAKILAITKHGEKNALEKLMMKENIPGYIFKPQFNPSGQPRLGVGYSVFGIMTMLAKSGMLKIIVREIEDILASMEIWSRELKPEEPLVANAAKKIAFGLCNKIPVLVGGEFLAGNLHAMRNQINECSKNFAAYLVLPDLNHYAMEGLEFPAGNRGNLTFLFFDSKLYHGRVKLRAKLTKQVINKNGIKFFSHELKGKTRLAQALELLQFGSWVSFYLGVLNQVDPVKIPWVDWFKKRLG